MQLSNRWFIAAVITLSFVNLADAQRQRPGGQRPGGQPGFQRPGGQGPGAGLDPTSMVVSNKALQEELKVTEEQLAKFKKISDEQTAAREKMRELFQGGDREKMRENMAKMREEMTAAREKQQKMLNETLTKEQKDRLKQISYQMMGLRAFSNPEVAEKLKFTAEQKERFQEISKMLQDENRKMMQDLGFGGRGGERPSQEKMAEFRKKMTSLQADAKEACEEELTSEQKATWKEMIGKEFDVSKLTQGFGGGRQRRDN